MKHKKRIALITAIILIISSVGIYGKDLVFNRSNNQVSAMLSFNYPGIDEGLNPYGGSFNINNVKSEEVLQATIDALGLQEKGIDTKLLASNILLKGYVPEDVMSRIMPKTKVGDNAQTQAVSGMIYHPTQYKVTLKLASDLHLSKKEATKVLETFISQYQSYFVKSYKDTDIIKAAINTITPERYDYSEYILLAESQLDIMKEYLLAKESVAKDFKSAQSGVSFSDLLSQIQLLKSVEIANTKAIIDTFSITKDKVQLEAVYQNRIDNLKREQAQSIQEKEIVVQAINNYQKDPVVILENGHEVKLEEKVQKDKPQREIPLYEDLMSQSLELKNKTNQLTYQMNYYQELLDKLKQNQISAATQKVYTEEVETTIKTIATRLSELVDQITAVTNEYYEEEVFKDSLTVVGGIQYESAFKLNFIKNTLMIGLITGFGLLISILYTLMAEDRKKAKNAPIKIS